MKNLGIKYQLRLITLMPTLLVAILFAVFYNGKFSIDLKQHILHLGEAYIHQLQPVAQLALLKGDERTLQGLINASMSNSEVKALAFYNAKGQLLAYRGGKHSLSQRFHPPEFTGEYIETKQIKPDTFHFISPITLPKFNLYAYGIFANLSTPMAFQADDVLGWLSLDIDMKSMLIKKYQMYIMTIFITLFGLILSLNVHYFFSKRIYLPIIRLRRSMKQILNNEFETQIKQSSNGELGIIEAGCVHLQKQYLDTVRELNQHIEVATADLQQSLELLEEKNIELSLEKKKAEEKSRLKSELIANMSHEIRTPMNGVIGFTNVLLESKLDPLQLDYVKTIKSSAQDLLGIINDILDYSKMDAGKLYLDCIPLDVRACIDEVLSLTAPMAHKKGIDLIPITGVNVPKIMLGDPLRLKQIISNLVSNAVKFTERGYVLIRSKIEHETEKEYNIAISVIDTGIGISPEHLPQLFNAFNQIDTNITRKYGGSGLGLVICKKLTEHMNGRITVQSKMNQGSTFTVHIQLEKLAAYEIEKYQNHRFSDLKIICFDDNDLHLEAICNGLGYFGIQCIGVKSLIELTEAFKIHSDSHLAFINIADEYKNEVTAIVREQIIPCVYVSKSLIENYRLLGAQGFIFKPPNIQKLHDTVDILVNQNKQKTFNPLHLNELRMHLRMLWPSILIAEDNPVNRMLLNSILAENANIELVANGEQALAASNCKPYDAILLDYQMPKMCGIEVAKRIRASSNLNREVPIFLISANQQQIYPDDIKNITGFLQKPIEEASLLKHLLEVIEKTKAPAINWALCVQKVSGNEALAREFLDRFIEELEKNREELINHMLQQDLKQVEQVTHKLHGACCFCGVTVLQHHVAYVEQLARNAIHTDEIKGTFEQLIKSIDAVLREYQLYYRNQSTHSIDPLLRRDNVH